MGPEIIRFEQERVVEVPARSDPIPALVPLLPGQEMIERISTYRELLAHTPVDELEVREHPRVIFRVDEVTWLDAIVRYIVPPREAGSVKTRLIPKLLAALNEHPKRVMFPKGDVR